MFNFKGLVNQPPTKKEPTTNEKSSSMGIQKRQMGNKALWSFVLGQGQQKRPMAHFRQTNERYPQS